MKIGYSSLNIYMFREENFINSSKIHLNKIIECYSLNLRDLELNTFGNTGILRDQFECIDISNNVISRLNNISRLDKLSVFIACNNKIEYIDELFCKQLLNLESLVLTNNKLSGIESISAIFLLKNLKRLSLIDNPVTKIPNYRDIIIYMLPNLIYLDFQKIKQSERGRSRSFAESDKMVQELARKYLKEAEIYSETKYIDNLQSLLYNFEGKKECLKLRNDELNEIKVAISSCENLEKLKILENCLIEQKISIEAQKIIEEYSFK
ncbi:hypothetical protein FG386_003210 [Cryptosporidium ryanae]|uniref:uncharacterized protein n=1 Tax=Cryptosporidium ryanae TaxID=515981 RepID=UPI003519E4E8|nr:hypothetical protein FG386_003210 [Cryptosporidium ryanae]